MEIAKIYNYFSHGKSFVALILATVGRETFWPIFSQSLPVTRIEANIELLQYFEVCSYVV
jgi:hypothetical protein